jgi:hypothetical protein
MNVTIQVSRDSDKKEAIFLIGRVLQLFCQFKAATEDGPPPSSNLKKEFLEYCPSGGV